MAADTSSQRSALKDFLASIATIRGDLSNITAPPFVLADKSTTELPRYWIEYPELFCAPAHADTPEMRILAVLKWFLASLKGQQYAGREPDQGVKKPLNAFLGEVFCGSTGPESDETRLVSEQVSHHPPVTACYLWNEKAGIWAEGYTRQEVTFTGSVNVRQFGYAVLHIEQYDENYLIPLPNVKVKGILTGGTYPELTEPCTIVSSSGFVAEVDFSGKGLLGGGRKNHVEAAVYRKDERHGNGEERRRSSSIGRRGEKDAPLFSVEGSWSESMTFKDGEGEVIETYDVTSATPTEFKTLPVEKQDPWESRKAWGGVIDNIHTGNMQGVADHKNKLENAQRQLRKNPETGEEKWEPLFFRKVESDPVAAELLKVAGKTIKPEDTCGIWKVDGEKVRQLERPWRGDLTPYG